MARRPVMTPGMPLLWNGIPPRLRRSITSWRSRLCAVVAHSTIRSILRSLTGNMLRIRGSEVSQKQQDHVERKSSLLEDEASAIPPSSSIPDTPQSETAQEAEKPHSPLVVSGRKRGRKKGRLVSMEEIMPKPSYWPLALAVSFVVLLMGIMISW